MTQLAGPLWATTGRGPDDLALDDGTRQRTWGELESRSNAVGNGCEALGIEPASHVALVASNRVEFIEVLIGAQRAGMVVTPVKANWTQSEITYLLDDASTRLVVTDVPAARAAALERGVPVIDLDSTAPDSSYESWLNASGDAPLPADRCGWRLSYTSGTTGRPKGVRHTGSGTTPYVTLFAGSSQFSGVLGIPSDGPHLVVSRLFHGAPLAFALGALAAGAPMRILERWDAAETLDLLETGIASTIMVPSMFRQLLALPAERRARFAAPALRRVLHGGEPCSRELKAAMIDWWGPIFTEYFGFTEGGMTIATTEEWQARPGTVGRALLGRHIVILGDDDEPLPPGTEGRVYFEDPAQRTFEYLNDADKTDSAYLGNKFTAGDIGWVDEDQYLYISGRKSEVIITSGVNVYPAEIEAVIAEVDGVADTCVTSAPHEERGEEVVAFIAFAPDVDEERVLTEVAMACTEHLAGYKRPRRIDVIDEIPRDPTGKVLRTRLRDELWRDASAFAATPQTTPQTQG